MRGTAVAFCFNAPRRISCVGPLIAGTLIVSLGGDDRRLILHPRCRRGAVPAGDERKTAPRHPVAGSGFGRAAGPHQLIVSAPSRISKLFSRFRKLIPSRETFRFSFTAAATLSIDSCSMRISRSYRRFASQAVGGLRALIVHELAAADTGGARVVVCQGNPACAGIDEKPNRCAVDQGCDRDMASRVGAINERMRQGTALRMVGSGTPLPGGFAAGVATGAGNFVSSGGDSVFADEAAGRRFQ